VKKGAHQSMPVVTAI